MKQEIDVEMPPLSFEGLPQIPTRIYFDFAGQACGN